jgi:hypothetical protein
MAAPGGSICRITSDQATTVFVLSPKSPQIRPVTAFVFMRIDDYTKPSGRSGSNLPLDGVLSRTSAMGKSGTTDE